MGAVETKSKSKKYIKPVVRNAIKKMAYMSQIANVSLYYQHQRTLQHKLLVKSLYLWER